MDGREPGKACQSVITSAATNRSEACVSTALRKQEGTRPFNLRASASAAKCLILNRMRVHHDPIAAFVLLDRTGSHR